MKFKKAYSALLLILAMSVMTPEGPVDKSTRGPSEWLNSPAVEYTPSGDRASPYPPYYQNQQ